jgi:ankyrin repeat protein
MQERKPLRENAQARKLQIKNDIAKSEKPALSAEEQRRLNYKLVRAAMDGNESEILRLIKAGADISATEEGCTALYRASMGGYNEICNILLNEYAKAGGDVKEIIAVKTASNWTALQVAARDGHTETCTLLLDGYAKAGGDVKEIIVAKNSSSFTPLHHAANTGHTETCALLINEYEKAGGNVARLIAAKNYGGETSIGRAMHQGRTETAQFLTVRLLEATFGKETATAFMPPFRECVSA